MSKSHQLKCFTCEKILLNVHFKPEEEWDHSEPSRVIQDKQIKQAMMMLNAAKKAKLHIQYHWDWPYGSMKIHILCRQCAAEEQEALESEEAAF